VEQVHFVLFGANGLVVEQVDNVLGLVLEVELIGEHEPENAKQIIERDGVEVNVLVVLELDVHVVENEVVEDLILGRLREATLLTQKQLQQGGIGDSEILDHWVNGALLVAFESNEKYLFLDVVFVYQRATDLKEVTLRSRVESVAKVNDAEETSE
jgi:hypothetical protein